MQTDIHHVVKYNKCRSTGLLLITNANLAYAAITPEEIVQILSGNLVIQILHEENPVRSRRKLSLRINFVNVVFYTKEIKSTYGWSCSCEGHDRCAEGTMRRRRHQDVTQDRRST